MTYTERPERIAYFIADSDIDELRIKKGDMVTVRPGRTRHDRVRGERREVHAQHGDAAAAGMVNAVIREPCNLCDTPVYWGAGLPLGATGTTCCEQLTRREVRCSTT
jgi:hypothetical protein